MNFERVIFGFFLILALALNLAFVVGEIDQASHHNVVVLTITILVNLITTGLKLGDRTQVGAILLSSSLVATLLLIAARIVWIIVADTSTSADLSQSIATIVSLGYGALIANTVSVSILVGDTLMSRR